jgi:multidrug resistance efflux pump
LIKPEKKAIPRTVEQPGSVQAFEETVLFPKLPGFVQTISLDPAKATRPTHDRQIDLGSRVTANQVLAELAMPELEQEYQQKEALVRQMEAEIVQAKKARTAAEAAVTSARAHVVEATAGLEKAQANYSRWQQEAERTGRLVSGGVIDAQTRDEIAQQFKAAGAGRSEAQARIASAEAAVAKALADQEKAAADIAATEAKRDVAKADARRVDALREYQRIKAPFDGIVTRRSVNPGDHVTADGKTGLFAVARVDPVRVVLRIPEADAGLVMEGQTVRVAVPPGISLEGKVTRTSWSLEPGSRTLRTEIDLPNPEAKLRPGMYATARLTVELPAEWTLPAAAIVKVADEPIAYLAVQGKAVRVAAQLGRGDGAQTQLRAYRKAGQVEWTPVSGNEVFAIPAAQLTDGQSLGQ